MKNVFVEGLQGMGKSTLVGRLAERVPWLHVCREGDYSPVDLAWGAWMTPAEHEAMLARFCDLKEEIILNTVCEGEHLIVTYTKIRTDDHSVYKAFEDYEIYNGRKTLPELKEIIFTRYANYCGTDGLFECAFFQNIIEDLILYHQLSDDDIVAFYRELYSCIEQKNFLLLYLYSDEVKENIEIICKERCDAHGNEIWYEMMLAFLSSCPYGKAHGLKTFDDLVAHLRRRQRLELRIIREVIGENAIILPAKGWEMESVAGLLTA